MRRFRCWLQRVGLAMMAVFVGAGAQAQAPGYSLQALGHPGGGQSWAFGISRSHVVGSAEAAGRSGDSRGFCGARGCLWNTTRVQDLAFLADLFSGAYGINGAGQAVGFSATCSGATHAFVWTNGRPRDLGTLGGEDSFAYAINEVGQVAGAALTADGQTHAFRWDRGRMRDLGTLGGSFSTAVAIDDAGRVVGSAETASGQIHAFRWINGVMLDLRTLGGSRSNAYGINNAGWIVGASESVDGRFHAFLWTDGVMRDLGTLGGRESYAYGINDAGQIVGAAETAEGRLHAFLYTRAQGMIDLNQRIDPAPGTRVPTAGGGYPPQVGYPRSGWMGGWELVQAQAIGASGEIVGWGRHNGHECAFLLSPAGDRVANRP